MKTIGLVISALLAACGNNTNETTVWTGPDASAVLATAWCTHADSCGLVEPVQTCVDRFSGVLADMLDDQPDAPTVEACLESIETAVCGQRHAGWGPPCWDL
jgi:hypothetical protein